MLLLVWGLAPLLVLCSIISLLCGKGDKNKKTNTTKSNANADDITNNKSPATDKKNGKVGKKSPVGEKAGRFGKDNAGIESVTAMSTPTYNPERTLEYNQAKMKRGAGGLDAPVEKTQLEELSPGEVKQILAQRKDSMGNLVPTGTTRKPSSTPTAAPTARHSGTLLKRTSIGTNSLRSDKTIPSSTPVSAARVSSRGKLDIKRIKSNVNASDPPKINPTKQITLDTMRKTETRKPSVDAKPTEIRKPSIDAKPTEIRKPSIDTKLMPNKLHSRQPNL